MKTTDRIALQRAIMAQLDRQHADDKLADTIPPVEPPVLAPVTFAKQHKLVRWHVNPARLTTVECPTLENAREQAAQLHWAAFYKYSIMCGREIIETKLVVTPADAINLKLPAETLSVEEAAAWYRSLVQ
jgi:hypothetical protein